MKKNLLIVACCLWALAAQSQETTAPETTVEKSLTGVQMSLLGLSIHQESRLKAHSTVRKEFGLIGGAVTTVNAANKEQSHLVLVPVLRVAPRWYYNLEKRASESKKVTGNSGNFLSCNIRYIPSWFLISGVGGLKIADQVSIIPTWGIRRSLRGRFAFEAGLGLGYSYNFGKQSGFREDESGVAFETRLRIGYRLVKRTKDKRAL